MARTKQPDGAATGVAISAKIGYLAGRMVATASSTYARLGVGSLEARVLELIGDRPAIKGADISRALGIDPAAVSRTVRTLAERGAISRCGSRVTLTDRGEGLCEAVRALSRERNRRMMEGLSEAEQALLEQYLERLWANTNELAEMAAMSPAFVRLED